MTLFESLPRVLRWWSEADLNRRHADFQSAALPTELPDHMAYIRVKARKRA